MATYISQLMEWLGLGTAPTNLAEFIPYFMGAMVGIGVLVLVLNILRSWGNPKF